MENKKSPALALALKTSVMLLEAAGGLLSGSLALGLFASWGSSRPRTPARTFGWPLFEIFAALLNGITLWAVAGLIG